MWKSKDNSGKGNQASSIKAEYWLQINHITEGKSSKRDHRQKKKN